MVGDGRVRRRYVGAAKIAAAWVRFWLRHTVLESATDATGVVNRIADHDTDICYVHMGEQNANW